MVALTLLFGVITMARFSRANDQFGPLMQPFLPIGDRLPGFPEVFPGLSADSSRLLLFPEDSAAIYEESVNRCKGLNGKLVELSKPSELETIGCLLSSPAFVGGWQGQTPKGCMVIMPGGSLIGTQFSSY